MRKARYPSINFCGNGMARAAVKGSEGHTIMPRLPLAIAVERRWVGKTLRLSGMYDAGLWQRRRGRRSDRRRPRPSAVHGSARTAGRTPSHPPIPQCVYVDGALEGCQVALAAFLFKSVG